ncbi:MAG: pantoate--beta-alanine ligase [Candidatus Tectomicrobia bacterium]|nr:pantoate--beta-alanine ligase [Candidatus Tectomicrobia bacterium]
MLHIIRTAQEMQAHALRQRLAGKRLGFVPTMGCLHEGHLSLVRAARRDCDVVVVSIFVNPLQFGPREDLAGYPRTLADDLARLLEVSADVVFAPAEGSLYPAGFATFVEVTGLTEGLCGARRPGHFRGVATVVCKLFNLVQPQRAYFGEKDYQQLQVIRRMVADLNLPLEVVGMPTLRQTDGLAMSSRNRYLSGAERQAATALWRSLEAARRAVAAGEHDALAVRRRVTETLRAEPLARLDYVEVCHPETLRPVAVLDGPTLIALAAYVGQARLIDNLVVCPASVDTPDAQGRTEAAASSSRQD